MSCPHENAAMIYAGLANELAEVLERVYAGQHQFMIQHEIIPSPGTQAVVEAILDLHKAVVKANPVYVQQS